MDWKYYRPKFEYEEKFDDLNWPWAGHKFFAYDLVRNVKPEIVVELGTHKGTSFFSFCQGIKDEKLETMLFAVDSWEGDIHAGHYDESVYREVIDIKKTYYGNLNIMLVRKDFNEAVNGFSDNSIDILHIDGMHTFETVRHDFETWLPKVKNNGIILFHDIVVTRDNFGVYKLWEELKTKFKTMEFHYSYGLGVLFKSSNNPIFKIKDDLEKKYSYLIEDIENKKIAEMMNGLKKEKEAVWQKEAELQEKNIEIEKINQLVRQKSEELENRNKLIQKSRQKIGQKNLELRQKEQEIQEGDTKLQEKEHYIQRKEQIIIDKDQEIRLKNSEIQEKNRELEEKNQTLHIITSSKTWKLLRFYVRILNTICHPSEWLKKITSKISYLYDCTSYCYRTEGFQKTVIRTLNYIFYGEAVLSRRRSRKKIIKSRPDNSLSYLEITNKPSRPEAKKILVADLGLPTYDKDSGSFRMFYILKILRELSFKVVFYPENQVKIDSYVNDLEKLGIEVVFSDPEDYLAENGHRFSHVLLSRPDPAFRLMPLVRAYAIFAKVYYDTVDLHWVRLQRAAELLNDQDLIGQSEKYKKIELANCQAADTTLIITENEREILKKEITDLDVEILTNIHEVSEIKNGFNKRKNLLFIGGFLHQPNVDAVKYFVKEIFPLIKNKVPGIKFYVVGSEPPEEIKKLNSEDVIVTGYKRNVGPYFENCRIFVSPLRYGAGMKGKIGQAMSFGLPVVTTSIGAEGMKLKNEENSLITDNPKDFAAAVIRLYKDEELWNKLSKNSQEHLRSNFSKEVIKNKISEIFGQSNIKPLPTKEIQNYYEDTGIGVAQQVSTDYTSKFDYQKLIEEEIECYSNIEVTEKLQEGGVHANEAWVYWFQYLSKNIWKTSFVEEIASFSNSIDNPRILSLGCGHGGFELEISSFLKKPFEIIALDLNGNIFREAEKKAAANDYNIKYLLMDLNFIKIKENHFNVIYAHASLHHLMNFEHIFGQFYKGLKKNGRFIVQEVIGKTQILFWKENIDFAIDIIRNMPSRYKRNILFEQAIAPPYLQPLIQKGMEGLRQEEIESQINNYFTPIKIFKFGSFIRMICTHPELGKIITPSNDTDREYLESLFRLDLQQVKENKLRPTELFAVYKKRIGNNVGEI